MKRFVLGLLGFVVVWIAGLAPQFLNYFHTSWIIIFSLEGLVSIAGYILFVRLIEKRKATELSRFRVSLLPLGAFVGLVWFALLILMLYVTGHYQVSGVGFPNRVLSAVIFALGTAICEEVTFRGLLFRVTEQTFGTWIGVLVSAVAFGAIHGLNPNASLAASIAIVLESGVLLLRLILPRGRSGYRSACTSDGILPRTSSLASGCQDTPRAQLSWKEH